LVESRNDPRHPPRTENRVMQKLGKYSCGLPSGVRTREARPDSRQRPCLELNDDRFNAMNPSIGRDSSLRGHSTFMRSGGVRSTPTDIAIVGVPWDAARRSAGPRHGPRQVREMFELDQNEYTPSQKCRHTNSVVSRTSVNAPRQPN